MDKRIEKTKRALQNALLLLLKTHSLDEITVTRLCSTANVNRNTLYFHYNGIYDILAEIEDQLIEEMRPFIGKMNTEQELSPLLQLCLIYYNHKDVLQTIFRSGCDVNFSNKVLKIAREPLFQTWTAFNHKNQEQAEKIYIYTVSGSRAILENWIRNGCPEPPQEIAGFIENAGAAVTALPQHRLSAE